MPWDFGPREASGFAERVVNDLIGEAEFMEGSRALDIGCAVGRSSFELARYVGEVVGIDYSHAFIEAANEILQEGSKPYIIKVAGELTHKAVAQRPDVPYGRVQFQQGDAQSLPEELGQFDVVLAANLICRLRRPQDFLKQLPALIKPGGKFLLATPMTWLEEFTPVTNWIGATAEAGETLEVLKRELSPEFELERTQDLPFLIREHARKFQWSVSQGTVWKRTTE